MAFFREVGEDIRNIVEKDPAARNGFEVLICYPGIWSLIMHRPAHWLYKHNIKLDRKSTRLNSSHQVVYRNRDPSGSYHRQAMFY